MGQQITPEAKIKTMSKGFVIKELFAYITKDESGDERIINVFNEDDDTWVPLMNVDIESVKNLKPIADKLRAELGLKYQIVRFSVRTDVTYEVNYEISKDA